MKNIELRWVAERISPSHKSMTLQYRKFIDHGGPYENYAWTDWMNVPTHDIELEKAAEIMSDKGYQVGDLKDIPNRCHCYNCASVYKRMSTFIVCPKCGNKRCPHATDHNLECTNSNEPGQKGSRYE